MEIMVKGTGEDYFTPDQVILSFNFVLKKNTYEEALQYGVSNVTKFVNEILIPNGFVVEELKTRSFVIREDRKLDAVTKEYVFDGYSFNQNAGLKFDYDKTKLAKILEDLSKMENAPLCQVSFGVKDEKECRRNLVSKAYEDAKAQAKAIANAAGLELSKCVKVDFKPFTTEYVSNSRFDNETSFKRSGVAQEIVNTFTPEDIYVFRRLRKIKQLLDFFLLIDNLLMISLNAIIKIR